MRPFRFGCLGLVRWRRQGLRYASCAPRHVIQDRRPWLSRIERQQIATPMRARPRRVTRAVRHDAQSQALVRDQARPSGCLQVFNTSDSTVVIETARQSKARSLGSATPVSVQCFFMHQPGKAAEFTQATRQPHKGFHRQIIEILADKVCVVWVMSFQRQHAIRRKIDNPCLGRTIRPFQSQPRSARKRRRVSCGLCAMVLLTSRASGNRLRRNPR